jgi:hypothetical protein
VGNVIAMSNFQQKLTELVNSPEVKKLTDRAQAFVNDPKTQEQIDKAKRKLAEIRDGGSTGGTAAATEPQASPEPDADAPDAQSDDPKAA